MTLQDGDATFAGVTMGARSAHGITWEELVGLTDLPRSNIDNPPPQRLHDPAVPGWADIGWRQITAANLQVAGDPKIRDLRSAMMDRLSIRPFVFADVSIAVGDLMVAVVADRLEYGRGPIQHSVREWVPSAQWLAADPTIYSSTATSTAIDTAGDPFVAVTVTNAGTFATPSGRQWTASLTATGGSVGSPYIAIPATGQVVTWQGLTMTTGQVLVVDVNRSSWVGALGLDGLVRSGSSEFPDWPILQPGANTVRVGCASGRLVGSLSSRSSW